MSPALAGEFFTTSPTLEAALTSLALVFSIALFFFFFLLNQVLVAAQEVFQLWHVRSSSLTRS